MTKKRVVAIVATGTLLFFMAAMIMNFWVVSAERTDDFSHDFRKI